MYGGSKLGSGGGRAVPPNKRNSFPPPPQQHRLSTPSSGNRLSLGSSASRNRTAGPSGATSSGGSKAVEETFSLVSGNNPLAFGMIIRLAPDLVKEIRRVESQGQMARIKFDSMANNPNGNVIEVGGKEFRFTWSRDGDLCDIYEEQQSGEDGDGLLVESGCAWRKVNVQRILDESTVNHVKMRSEEAERKLKQRKAIVLDHGNPSMKSQIKQLAAVEANPWRMHFKRKKEPPPFKKQKVETLQASGPSKSTNKSGAPSSVSGCLASPLSSPPGQSGAPASPAGTGIIVKNHMSVEEITPIKVKNKESASNSEKEITSNSYIVRETPGSKGCSGNQSTDLKNMLITLLMENPKGMSLKALEKAIGDTSPNSVGKIELIIKKIATLQAPGRYFLKPGVKLGSTKKPTSESGSSPVDNCQQTPASDNMHGEKAASGPSFVEEVPTAGKEEQFQSNSKLGEETLAMEKTDVQQFSPGLFSEKKVSDHSEGHPASSSDSGSDSDSDSGSSDSGSDSGSHSRSRSRSRSRSPVGSGSGNSSDSETDASSNSKEASDEDVDIMTSDDDKEYKQKLSASEQGCQHRLYHGKQDNDGSDAIDIEGQGSDAIDIEGEGSDAIDIEKGLPDDEQEVEMAVNTGLFPSREAEKPVERTTSLIEDNELQECQNFIGNLFDDNELIVKNSLRSERSKSPEKKLKNKSKRGPDLKHSDEMSDHSKRSKADSSFRLPISVVRDPQFPDSPLNSSPNRSTEDPYKGPTVQMMNRDDREGSADFGFQKGYNQDFSVKRGSDFQQSSRKSFDKSLDKSARSKAHDTAERPNKHDQKFSGKNYQVYDGFPLREKTSRETQNEDGFKKVKKGPRNPREGGPGTKNSVPLDSNYGKYGEMHGKFNETGQMGNGRSNLLHREHSDLELGELREPLHEEVLFKKQFDMKGSFKQSENMSSTSDNCNSDLIPGKSVGNPPLDSGKTSPCNLSIEVKRAPENRIEDWTRTHHRPMQPQPQGLSRETQSVKESKTQTSNSMANLVDVCKDAFSTESNDIGRKRRESSSDEDNCSYYKYEKDKPELKGTIKDISQYKEYMQEYHDKYESYISLNKTLESCRKKFNKLGKDLEFAQGRDMERYYKLLGQLKVSYHQCGAKHKRLKKIFIVLHEELKHLKQSMKDFAISFNKD
ncbi:uncharacterized protein LOC123210962 [Mangifera indica]|uniref:uncharacterized protein LOC123210962 n=1 Tax=Mangifera indica TaxID=29780 RepID=UPI001CFB161E|nr:uncharacterized protein LOC123210962 [Mangifera indica]